MFTLEIYRQMGAMLTILVFLITSAVLASSDDITGDQDVNLATKLSFKRPHCFPKLAGPSLTQSHCLATLWEFASQCPDEECIFTSEESERDMHIIGQLFLRATFQSDECYLSMDMPREIDTVVRTQAVQETIQAIVSNCIEPGVWNGGHTTFESDDGEWISAVVSSRNPDTYDNAGGNDTVLENMHAPATGETIIRKK